MNEAEKTANDLARLLAEEHAQRIVAEETASELAVLLVQQREELERERKAREQAEAQAQELSTLIIGDEPRQAGRFIPQRTRLRSVS
jgi:hypothetical protein